MNADVRKLCGASVATADRIFVRLLAENYKVSGSRSLEIQHFTKKLNNDIEEKE